uniref:(northern house mosquito) hypothetical protein n=1 Tax=Culex pipiens TaxID=7175 RepID=A0A8D8PD55_CULPI
MSNFPPPPNSSSGSSSSISNSWRFLLLPLATAVVVAVFGRPTFSGTTFSETLLVPSSPPSSRMLPLSSSCVSISSIISKLSSLSWLVAPLVLALLTLPRISSSSLNRTDDATVDDADLLVALFVEAGSRGER